MSHTKKKYINSTRLILSSTLLLILRASFFVGLILSFIFSWKFIFISFVPFINLFFVKTNIPFISPLFRWMHWDFVKESILKEFKSPIIQFPLAIHLEMNSEIKKTYIWGGEKKFAIKINEWYSNMQKNIDELIEQNN